MKVPLQNTETKITYTSVLTLGRSFKLRGMSLNRSFHVLMYGSRYVKCLNVVSIDIRGLCPLRSIAIEKKTLIVM